MQQEEIVQKVMYLMAWQETQSRINEVLLKQLDFLRKLLKISMWCLAILLGLNVAAVIKLW